MKTDCLPFDIGIEQEFFISPKYEMSCILNSKEEMKKIFGFSVDQNDGYKGIQIDNCCDLVSDGTVMEVRGFFPIHSYLPSESLKNAEKIKEAIKKCHFVNGFYHNHEAYVESGQPIYNGSKSVYKFDNPNNTFSSEKLVRDAYTGKEWYQEKKEDAKVTVRTAGLHVHFSLQNLYKDADQLLFDKERRYHVDNLVKLFDKIYKQYFHIQASMQKRIDFYQPFGLYRIKDKEQTKSGLHSIEYRQPASAQIDYCFDGFLLLCQNMAYNYLIDNKIIK